jgi:uncharacterized protein YhbP (UPF0306 family)
MPDDEVFVDCLEFLRDQAVMTLASCKDNKPWACDLLYVADDQGCLYFLSAPGTRHVGNLEANELVSVSVHAQYTSWFSIKGVQCEAVVTRLDDSRRDRVEQLYYERFTDIGELIRNPQSEDEKKISQAYQKIAFYCVKPHFMRLIDNREGFATRREWAA